MKHIDLIKRKTRLGRFDTMEMRQKHVLRLIRLIRLPSMRRRMNIITGGYSFIHRFAAIVQLLQKRTSHSIAICTNRAGGMQWNG